MIKVIMSDFSRTLLFPKDKNYTGKLNSLHEELKELPNYNIWGHYRLNQDLISFYKKIENKVDVYIFTTKYIQEWPPLKEELDKVFKGTFIASKLDVKKDDAKAYELVAKKLGYSPNEIIFIDDEQKNLDAASKAGMVVILFKSEKQAIKDIARILK